MFWKTLIAAFAVTLAGCIAVEEATKTDDLPLKAYIASQRFVKEQLKAPATADFPWFDPSMATKIGEGNYTIRAYVDSENSFGAKLRSNYSCGMSSSNYGETWTCRNLDISEN